MGNSSRTEGESTSKREYRCYYCKVTKPEDAFYLVKGKHRPVSDFCKPCKRALDKAYRDKNKEACSVRNLEYQATHREVNNAATKRWRENHPEQNKAQRRAREAITRGAPDAELIDIETLHLRDKGICQLCQDECSLEEASIDHKIPVSKGGRHTWDNVQLAHLRCNCGRRDKDL